MSADSYFTTDSFFRLLSSFRRLISSELTERNSTISGHMIGSKCNLKTHDSSWIVEYEHECKVLIGDIPAYFRVRLSLLAPRCVHRTNRRAIAMMFICLSVCLSVSLSATGVHCYHTLYFSADVNSPLDSPMFCAPKHVHLLSAVFLHFHPEEKWDMDVQSRRSTKRNK